MHKGTDVCLALEGCLSMPGIRVPVVRHDVVLVEYFDVGFVKHVAAFSCVKSIRSRVVQHEIDHLDGVMMIDRVSKFARSQLLRRYYNRQQQ
ncbi:peptide deformylase, partial [Streptococcus pyogenes]